MSHWTLLYGGCKSDGCDGHTVTAICLQKAGFRPVLIVDPIRLDNLAVADVAEASLPGLTTQLAGHGCAATPSAQ